MATAYTDQVQKVYIAYYGRAADPVGLTYWAAKVETDGLAGIMASFGASAEATTLYGSLTNTAKVNALYQQSFGRDADFAGLMYYAGQLTAGTMTAASIAQNIFDGASGNDATILANKVIVAKAYTAAIDTAEEVVAYSGTVAAASARTLLATVDAATVTASFDVATTVASIVTASNNPAPTAGSSFTLTPNTDVAGKTSATNGSLASTFRFSDSANETVTGDIGTVQAADILLDGSSTDQDVLNLTLTATTGTFTANRIENINSEFAAGTPILDLTNVTNAKAYSVTGTVAGSIEEIDLASKGAPITVKDFTKVLTINTEQLSGTAALTTGEKLDVTLTGALKSSASIATGVTLTADAGTGELETLNITSSGTAANEFTLDASTNVTLGTVNFLGATNLTTHVSHADVTGITLVATAATGTQNLVVDRTGATTTATNANLFTGFDTISLLDSAAPAVGGDSASVSGLKSGQNITLLDDFNSTVLAFSAVTGTADSATVTLDNDTALTDLDVAQIDIQNVETLNIVSSGFATSTATAGENLIDNLIGDAATITVSGDTSLNLDLNIDAPTSGSRVVTVNASTNTAFVDMVADTNSKVSYNLTGTAGKDTLTLNGSGGTLNGGLGNDTLTTGAGNDTVTTGGGTNTVTGSAGTDSITMGTGVDTVSFGIIDIAKVVQVSKYVSITDTASVTMTTADFLSLTVNGETYTQVYATSEDITVINHVAAHAAAILAASGVTLTATNTNGDFTLTGAADGTAFTSSALINDDGVVRLDVTTATATGLKGTVVQTTITGFDTGAVDDVIAFGVAAINAATGVDTIHDGDGDAAAADDIVLLAYTVGTAFTDTDGVADGQNVIKVNYSNTINSSANLMTAIDANTITLDTALADTDAIATVFYDADGGTAVFGVILQANSDGAVIDDDATFSELGSMQMTTTEYAALGVNNFGFIA